MAEAQKDKKEDPKDAFERLTGTQKSAILMMLIGEEEASPTRNPTPCACS